ncbi:MAG TPA: FKBP-type peptidyl-prolyl cis-trans isomerase [Lentimicrobium sp.]|jgi:FKBP-type peptidyl-prolyl cis-trans isomerase|nr:FKBP-type peptidyl-prolyl cis-trans isomerase [Lentimicrobium sp.]
MKKITGVFALLLLVTAVCPNGAFAQKASKKKSNAKTQPAETVILQNRLDSISYIIGRDIGRNMTTNSIEVNEDIMFAGLKDGLRGIDSVLSEEATEHVMSVFQQEMMMKQQQKTLAESSVARAAGEAFLEANKTQPGVVALPSGLQFKVVTEGEGEHPSAEDIVEVHYTGTLIDGTVFDSSVERGESIKFPLNGVIPGWTEGVQLMKPGSKYIFYIPSALAYGDRGAGPIPGGSVLIFEVELISVEKQ